MRPHYLPAVPSVAKYKVAFLQIRANFTSGHVSMLKAQYDALGHTLTARELASAAGYKNFNAANLQYGKIGNMLREVLNYWDNSGQASYVLSWFLQPNDAGKEWSIVMHKEVSQALQELNWFGTQQTDNYVQYHNSNTMGVSCLKLMDNEESDFSIATSKSVSKLIGSRIWLIGGIDKPRKYYLCYYFYVDEIELSDGYSSFKYSVYGQKGKIFKPAILLNNFRWFKSFLKSQQNFSLGLRKIEKRYVNELENIVDSQEVPYSNILQEIDQFKHNNKTLQETTREAIIQSRIGQGQFRTSLIEYWQGCSVTGYQQIELLRASHIKPWRDSSNVERLDMYNGLLLLPNLDVCFDSGLISFDDKGKIIISSKLDKSTLSQLGIDSKLRLLRLEKRHKNYLRYHRENRFCP